MYKPTKTLRSFTSKILIMSSMKTVSYGKMLCQFRVLVPVHRQSWKTTMWDGGGGGVRLKVVFQESVSDHYHQLQIWFDGVCRCIQMWWVNVDLSCLGPMIYVQPPTQFCHRWTERKHSDHYTVSEPDTLLPNSLVPRAKLRTTNLPVLHLWCNTARDRTPACRTNERML